MMNQFLSANIELIESIMTLRAKQLNSEEKLLQKFQNSFESD
jgi:hypothetical protein